MDSNKEHEKIAMEIAKTSDSIRKKYRALKTGKMEEEIALKRHFKPITEPLKQLYLSVQQDVILGFDPLKGLEPTRKDEDSKRSIRDCQLTSIRHLLQTSEGQEKLHANYGPLGQKYLKAVLSGKEAVNIDVVYGVYFSDEGTMLGDKRITLSKNDDIIIDGQRYDGTPGLYELIFMRFSNESICTDDDVQTYKSILLTTNAYRRGHNAGNQVLGNKGHKYKNIIAPLVLGKKVGTVIKKKLDLPCAMSLTDNRIDYVHWDDPNDLVDRLRLLEASRQADHNGHDNEILSIIVELREAGLIIN
ncbi:hypothetical protein ALC62_14726 [Cyphomyrmex costatus]|uniref:DUF8207 domain-containing protein n=1 Tax=Cyphomyrmex costatus TaxID=456900 RepID=A0A151I8J1_9HYME|nr:hypothetical protein ALC62_14726 [Cyphomyrmex costatus]